MRRGSSIIRGAAIIAIGLVLACGGKTTAVTTPSNPLLAPGRHAITVDGVSLSFEVRGQGQPCIAIPGGPGFDAEYLHSNALETAFTMVYVDPIGTGASGKLAADQKYSGTRDVETVEALRRAFGLEQVCVLGHSYGGAVAQHYAITHPDRVRALILYAATPASNEEWTSQIMSNLQRLKDKPWFQDMMSGVELEDKAQDQAALEHSFQLELPMYFGDWDRDGARLKPVIDRSKLSFDVYKHREPASTHDLRPALAQLHMPTLVIAGEKDPLNGVVPSGWFAKAMPHATVVVIPDCGHLAHLEQPDAFARAIDSFAKSLH